MSRRFWPIFALIVASIVFFALLLYILDTPLPGTWDEAHYFKLAHSDQHALQEGGFRSLLRSLLHSDPSFRPPAYRLLVLPYNLLFGVHPTSLKAHSLFFWCLTLWLMYLTGNSLVRAGVAPRADAGALAVIYLAMCPIIISTAKVFFTEYALYFAIAAMLFVTVQIMQSRREQLIHWMALAGCVALGALAKLSFFFILAPFALILLFLGLKDVDLKPRPRFLITAIAFGGLLALPWWLPNLASVLHFTFNVTATFEPHSLGRGFSPGKALAWLRLIWWTVLGPSVALISVVLLAIFPLRRKRFSKQQKTMIGMLLLTAAPTFILAFAGTNNNPRYLGPALLPLGLALSMVAERVNWLASWRTGLATAALIVWQLAVTVWPTPGDPRYQRGDDSKTVLIANYTNTFRRSDQWDWEPFWELVSKQGGRPSICLLGLGLGSPMNPAQVSYPWAKRNVDARVRLLWRYELGPLELEPVMREAAQCNVIVTAPGYIGKRSGKYHLDNRYNTEFANRLEGDDRFEGPVRLSIGKYDPVELTVFFTKAILTP